MATEHGAQTTGFADAIGILEPGKAADLVVMKRQSFAYPYLDDATPVLDAIVHRGKASGVETVLVAGEPVLHQGQFTRVNKAEVLEELATALQRPLQPDEEQRRQLSSRIFAHVQQFYEGWLDETTCDPFYRPSSRH